MTRIKKLRLESGLTQYQLAAQIGIEAPLLSRLENGVMVKVSRPVEEKIDAFYGPEWTFSTLIEEVFNE